MLIQYFHILSVKRTKRFTSIETIIIITSICLFKRAGVWSQIVSLIQRSATELASKMTLLMNRSDFAYHRHVRKTAYSILTIWTFSDPLEQLWILSHQLIWSMLWLDYYSFLLHTYTWSSPMAIIFLSRSWLRLFQGRRVLGHQIIGSSSIGRGAWMKVAHYTP